MQAVCGEQGGNDGLWRVFVEASDWDLSRKGAALQRHRDSADQERSSAETGGLRLTRWVPRRRGGPDRHAPRGAAADRLVVTRRVERSRRSQCQVHGRVRHGGAAGLPG